MKKWKKIALGTALSGTTLVGSCNYAMRQSSLPDDKYLTALGYDNNTMDTDSIIEASRKLHSKIGSPQASDHQASMYDPDKVPYAVLEIAPEDFRRYQLEYAILIGNKKEITDPTFGKLRVTGEDETLYKLVDEAVNRHNAKYPQAQIAIPQFILTGKKTDGAFYNAYRDVLFVNTKTAKQFINNPDEALAILGHELEHKAQSLSPVPNGMNRIMYYNVAQQAAYMGNHVFADCTKAGLTDTDITEALPYDYNAFELAINPGTKNVANAQIMSSKMQDAKKWVTTPFVMWKIHTKLKAAPTCNDDIDQLRESRNSAIYDVAMQRNRAAHIMEYDADKAGAETTSPASMINALTHTVEDVGAASTILNNSTTLDNLHATDHPTLKNRGRAIGCRVKPKTLGTSFVIRCDASEEQKNTENHR